jgi:hypothetical protein
METNEPDIGFWAGMPTRLKAHLIAWGLYWALTVWLVTLGSLIGIALLIAPILWFIAKAWVFDSFLELDTGGPGVLNYTLGFIWNASGFVRTLFMMSVLAVALGGLGWLGTEDLRIAAAEPTLIERISGTASNVADATAEKTGAAVEVTKDTTKGWMDRAKGWFGGDEVPVE